MVLFHVCEGQGRVAQHIWFVKGDVGDSMTQDDLGKDRCSDAEPGQASAVAVDTLHPDYCRHWEPRGCKLGLACACSWLGTKRPWLAETPTPNTDGTEP